MNLTRWTSPPQRSEDVLDFHYGLLRSPKTSIRLAQILPGSGNKGVSITLIDSYVNGSGKIPYDALSYTWGAGARSKSIICNGKRLAVTKILLEALQRFRDPVHCVTLWIDQICICQDRVKERNQQVSMMGDIFKSARKVIVWLGEDYDDSRAGMQLARQLLHIATERQVTNLGPGDLELHGLPRQGHKRWRALAAVLRRPWFWRTWIIQEVVLNPTVELVLGMNMLTWDELELVVSLLEGPIPKSWKLDHAVSTSELPFSRINRIRLRHQRMIRTPVTPIQFFEQSDSTSATAPDDSDIYLYADDPELLDLLLMSRGLGATDPRDKIYALLGLGKHDINPDYSMSPQSVFTDFALQTIGNVTQALAKREAPGLTLSADDLQVRRAIILLACAGLPNQRLPGLPSWVPDWTVSLSSRPLIFGFAQKRYSAGGSKVGVFDWDHERGLHLSGILLDTVQVVGSVLLDTTEADDGNIQISKWWQESRQIALERVSRSPGSTTYTDSFEAMRRKLAICRHGYYVGESRPAGQGSLLNDTEGATVDAAHSVSKTLTLGPTRGRVMFASGTGFLGLVPFGTRQGDNIVIVRGADVPFVLRHRGEAYELIGEAYVQGVMNGEALDMGHLIPLDIMIQ
ncbi:hypothetical protein M433DRAFT_6604 [Acidomyces richmondensis BFW]|nr:MAG: hypothetical protein FE78DRAFT_34911 [Acidomyces sp. 'richmondensis']KYG43102.1 hypothetical protein M433DRAFT_6604 [Acidomyces richmondensis BFW]